MSIEQLLLMSDETLHAHIISVLVELDAPYYYDAEQNYIVTDFGGDLPMVCVHIDTVGLSKPTEGDIVSKRGLVFLMPTTNARCLGADDRAGIWIALEMLKTETKTKFNYGFFGGEESGCIGSSSYALAHHRSAVKGKNSPQCFIGLDRATKSGVQNIATYGYDNEDLLDLFEEHTGYKVQSGSVSDCSNLSGSFDVPCLNLSVGYQHEHSSGEFLDIMHMQETLEMMRTVEIPCVPYELPVRGKIYAFPTMSGRTYGDPSGLTDLKEYADFTDTFWEEEESLDRKRGLAQYVEEEELVRVLCEDCGSHAPLFQLSNNTVICESCLQMYGLSLEDLTEDYLV